jgi:hypothetical protein
MESVRGQRAKLDPGVLPDPLQKLFAADVAARLSLVAALLEDGVIQSFEDEEIRGLCISTLMQSTDLADDRA